MNNKIEKSEKTICFSREKFLERLKQEGFLDTSGKTRTKTIGPRIWGPGLQYSFWRSYEEPLQPSCLGNNKN